jgi:cytohesin
MSLKVDQARSGSVQMPEAVPSASVVVPKQEMVQPSALDIQQPVKGPSRSERAWIFVCDVWYAFWSLFSCSTTADCLIQAINSNDMNRVRGLLFRGADPDGEGADGMTPLQAGYNAGSVPMVLKMIDCGAVATVNENAPILCQALRDGNIDMAAALIASGKVDVNELDKSDMSPLMLAYRGRDFPLVKQLVQAGAQLKFADKPEVNVFHLAVSGGGRAQEDGQPMFRQRLGWALDLLKEGLVKVNPQSQADQEAFVKVMKDKKGALLVQAMVERGFDVNTEDGTRNRPLSYAFQQENHDLALFLAQHQADFVAYPQDQESVESFLLQAAKRKGWEDVAQALLGNLPATLDNNKFLQRKAEAENYQELRTHQGKLFLQIPEDQTARTALHYACVNGNEALALALIEKGVNVDAQDSDGMTALHYAAVSGQKGIVEALLAKQAQIGLTDTQGRTAFDCAVEAGNKDVALLLLTNGAVDSAARPALLRAYQMMVDIHPDESAASQYAAQVQVVNYRELILALIERGLNVNATDPATGATLLHLAAANDDMAIVQAIMAHGGNVALLDGSGRTACQHALAAGHHEIAAFLVSKDAVVTGEDLKQLDQAQYSTFVQELLKIKTPTGKRRAHPMQFLNGALQRKDAALINILIDAVLEEGAAIDVKDKKGRSLADYALLSGDFARAVLLKRKGSPIDSKIVDKLTNAQYRSYVLGLITPDPETNLRSSPQSFIYSAALRGDAELLKALVKAGADPKALYVKAGMYKGYAPIHIAAKAGHVEAVQALIALGTPDDLTTSAGETPLHVALLNGQRDVFGYLVTRYSADKAKLELPDSKGRRAIHMAVVVGDLPSVAILLEAGAEIDGTTKSKLTALHFACALGKQAGQSHYYEIAKLLIAKGANKEAADRQGRTPVQFVPESDPVHIRELFKMSPKAHKALQGVRKVTQFFGDVVDEMFS